MPTVHVGRILESAYKTGQKRGGIKQYAYNSCIYIISNKVRCPSYSTTNGMPAGCGNAWPVHVDTTPLPHDRIPAAGEPTTATRYAGLPDTLRQAVPVLGVCRGFPLLDGRADEPAAAGDAPGLWDVDVPGAQRGESQAGQARV